MQITGTIITISPPDYTDGYGTHYQNLVVQTPSGAVVGRKGAKTPYVSPQDLNRQVTWDVEVKTNSNGEYNYFRKPQDPRYATNVAQPSPQPAPPQAPQGQQQPPQQPNAREDCIIRQACLKAVFSAAEIPLDMIGEYLTTAVNYAKTGQWQLSPNALPAGRPVDYVPPVDESDIPF